MRAAVLLTPFAFTLVLAGCAPARKPLPTIGYLQITTSGVLEDTQRGYLHGLADGGFVDGKTAHVEVKDAQGDLATAQLIARDFASRKVSLIAAAATPSLQAAIKATPTIPIVFCTVASPKKAGAGESNENHLPNVTGVICADPIDKAVALLHECMPEVKTIGTLHDPSDASGEFFLAKAKKQADALGLRWVEAPVNSPTDILAGVQALHAKGVEAIAQIPGSMIGSAIGAEIKQARSLGMPFFSAHPSDVPKGAVAAVGWDFEQAGYDAGQLAAQVLRGASAASIPFRSVQKESLSANTEAAAALHVTLPPAVTQRAAHVVNTPPVE